MVRADFGDVAMFDHHEGVDASKRAETVGGDECCAAVDQIFQRQLNAAFRVRIDR